MEQLKNNESVLKVSNLKTYFFTSEGTTKAVDSVDFEVKKGEVLGLVGESGCGKSVTALSLLQLLPSPPGRIVDGSVEFMGSDLLKLGGLENQEIRGQKISMINQRPEDIHDFSGSPDLPQSGPQGGISDVGGFPLSSGIKLETKPGGGGPNA
jgi:ABC-type glutathione transport system ATPase component